MTSAPAVLPLWAATSSNATIAPIGDRLQLMPQSHCPKCQSTARDRWLAERAKELLPVPYCHVVFTVPESLAMLILQNAQLVYGLLFRAVSQTLLEIAADPRHLGAQIGFLAVLHSWSQNLLHHPHIHCVVPAGGLHQTDPAGSPAAGSSSFQSRF